MSLFDTIANFFKSPVTEPTESDQRWREGYKAFQRGQDLYYQKDNQKDIQEALRCFDTAIDSGFEGADVSFLRGICLRSLGFHLDAIDDFTMAIELAPDDSNYYFARAGSKGFVGDLQGKVADLQDAIRVAEIDCASSRRLNEFAKERGYDDGVAGRYRMEMRSAKQDLEFQGSDERRLQRPGGSRRPDLVTRRRSQAHRRTR